MEKIGKRIQLTGNTVRIRSPKNIPLMVFLTIWLAGWTAGGVTAIAALMTGNENGAPKLFMAVWLCMWLFGEAFALVTLLWGAFGEEVLSLKGGDFVIKMSVFEHGLTKKYPVYEIKNLRATGFFGSPVVWSSNLRMYGMSGGVISFECNGKTRRFGIGLKEEDAIRLVERLKGTLGIS